MFLTNTTITMKKITLFILFTNVSMWAQSTCSTAIPIDIGTHTVSSIAGSQAITLSCSSSGNATLSEWFTFTPTTSGSYTISTDLPSNTGKDTRVHVYTGDCTNLTCLAGNDDIGSNYLSLVNVGLQANTTYYIVFDNRWQSTGFDFSLAMTSANLTQQVNFTQVNIANNLSYQMGAFDMNGDGLDDIVQVASGMIQVRPQISGDLAFSQYTNYNTTISHLPSWSMAGGDLNGDGYNDLVFGGSSGATIAIADYDNDTFITYNPTQYIFSQRSNMIDINNDGKLDVFVCHDVAANTYFINNGNNSFTFNQGGIGDHPNGGNYGSIWVDYNNDHLPDLFLAKCRGGQSTAKLNQLFVNNGDGTFTEVSEEANMNHPNQTWSSAWGDYDNDGYMDAFIGISSTSDGGHLLMHNNGDGTFTDITAEANIPQSQFSNHEFVAVDINNDGWIDIYTGVTGVFYNNGDGTFTPVYTGLGAGALADLNNDGFMDVYGSGTIYYNQGNDNNWLKIKLVGTESNPNGIGARIEIYADNPDSSWQKQIRDVRSGEGFAFMGSLNAHFGLGQETSIEKIVVHWPSGLSEYLDNPEINQLLVLVEGSMLSNPEIVMDGFKIYPNPTVDYLHIESLEATYDWLAYEIYTLDGKLVAQGQTTHRIDIQTLAQGTYVLRLRTSDRIQNIKFLKK